MNIRQAVEKDTLSLYKLLEKVQALHAEGRPDIFVSGTNKYGMEEIKKIIKNPLSPVYVAVDENDNAIGYAFCSIEEQSATNNLRPLKTFYIDDLCVSENLRGKGIGTKLYEHALKMAKKFGCYHLTLNVWHLNKTAVAFYEKLKMTPLKTTMEQIIE